MVTVVIDMRNVELRATVVGTGSPISERRGLYRDHAIGGNKRLSLRVESMAVVAPRYRVLTLWIVWVYMYR